MADSNYFKFELGDNARNTLESSLNRIAKAVGSTMGPGGMPFGFDQYNIHQVLMPSYTKDGLTVLKALRFNSPHENAILEYCKQASMHSVIASGDGTTSTIVLANAVVKAIRESKSKYPQAFARKIKTDSARAINEIRKEALKTDDVVKKVAMTSANGDEELADVVIEAIKKSSAFGTLVADKNPLEKEKYKIEKQDGYGYCRGYNWHSPLAVSVSLDAASQKTLELNNPYVALFNGAVFQDAQILHILKAWNESIEAGEKKSLVIVAYDVGDEIGNKIMVMNRKLADKGVAAIAVKTKLIGESNGSIQILRDLAAYSGIRDEHIIDGGNYRDVNVSFFGSVKKVKISPESTIFLGRGDNHWVEERVMQNHESIKNSRSMFDSDWVKYRNAELAEGLVKVVIGGGPMPDLQERADRFDDASKAAQACMRSGAIPGGGYSYIRAAELADVHPSLKKAFRSIYENVLTNYGTDPDSNLIPASGEGYKIESDDSIKSGNAVDLGILDSFETLQAVITNGVELGVMIATMGGFLYRTNVDSRDLTEYDQQ